ncbi:DUF4352 domain-containing protein [Streptomyces mutabilis]|uniref:DUF4352 domain-containing protein n=1 Tax=Streptomyces mutabilis TaxID=67332 RepID=UPI0017859CA0|nr:DUF4352 domain-containing protein [Streptomyces mutabilis]GGQ38511.1 hypothetical protein GCM10010279_54770 [Streptomyces mutabilis]
MNHRTTAAIAALAAAGLLTLTSCSLDESSVDTTPKTNASKADTNADSPKEAPSSPAPKKKAGVGDTLTVTGFQDGEQLDVTLKKWLPTAKSSDPYFGPEQGKRWAAAQFEIVNTGSKAYSDSPSNGAQVADGQGQRFSSWFGEITAGPSMASDVNLPKGEKALGWIVFEVPKDSKITSVQFAMNSGFADETGQWQMQ